MSMSSYMDMKSYCMIGAHFPQNFIINSETDCYDQLAALLSNSMVMGIKILSIFQCKARETESYVKLCKLTCVHGSVEEWSTILIMKAPDMLFIYLCRLYTNVDYL